MTNNAKSEEVNEKLDKCACLLIECYQELLTKRSLLDKCLDDGYLNLSKARSLVGCANLSILQVPNEIEPIVTIEENTDEDLIKTEDGDYELKYETTQMNILINNNKTSSITKSENLIPLPSWFGVLTPLSLKTSQKSFTRSLFLITSICELQIKLESLQITYKDLLKEKNKLL